MTSALVPIGTTVAGALLNKKGGQKAPDMSKQQALFAEQERSNRADLERVANQNRKKSAGGQGSYRQSLLTGLETGVAPVAGGRRTSLG